MAQLQPPQVPADARLFGPAPADLDARNRLWLATATLWKREMVRFFRQRNRVIGAIATPLMFWVLLGSGFNRSFVMAGSDNHVGYLEYFFPGTIILVLLFTAIFSTISVIEDRREGFLQAVLVAPIPRLAIVLGKVLGGASIAALQGLLFMLAWPVVANHFPGIEWMAAGLAILFVTGMGLTAVGLCIAWPMDSTAGYHAVMNLFLMPMWFLSGAAFPAQGATGWVRFMMLINPLTYGQAAFREALNHGGQAMPGPVPLEASVIITCLFTAAVVGLACVLVSRPGK